MPRGGKRRGREFWIKTIAAYKRSGLSQRRFCEQAEVHVGTFRSWLSDLGDEAEAEHSAFMEVVGASEVSTQCCVVRIGFTEIEFYSLPEPEYLAELLAALRAAGMP